MKPLRAGLLVMAALLAMLLCDGALQAQTASSTATASGAAKMQFFLKLVPPRPTFANDMTASERALMEQHAVYWMGIAKTGKLLMLGPVLKPDAAFGIAVVEVASEAEAHELADNDPTVKAGLNKMEISPMRVAFHR